MAGTVSGSVRLVSSLSVAVAASGNVITGYNVPTQPDLVTSYGAGTGPNQANKVATLGGTLAATTLDTDLTAVVCTDGSAGFSHVRELIIFNDDTVSTHTLLTGSDGVVTNGFAPYLTGTTPVVHIEPGSPFRVAKPIGTNGWVVDSTHKTLRIDAGANSVPYRIIVVGD